MCERCGEGEWRESRHVKMMGGRHARLCCDCQNEWHELATKKLRARFDEATARVNLVTNMAHAGKDVPLDDFREILAMERVAEDEAFALSGEFMAKRKPDLLPDLRADRTE